MLHLTPIDESAVLGDPPVVPMPPGESHPSPRRPTGAQQGQPNDETSPAGAPADLSGSPGTPVKVATPEELRKRLIGTKWDWPDHNLKDAWFTLNADGTVTAGWHSTSGLWTVTSASTITAVIRLTNRTPEKFDVAFGGQWALKSERGEVCNLIDR